MTDADKIAKLQDTLLKAAAMIEAEFCSHRGPHIAENENCSAQFIYQALRDTE